MPPRRVGLRERLKGGKHDTIETHTEYVEKPEGTRSALERALASGRAAVVNLRADEAARSAMGRLLFSRTCKPGERAPCARVRGRAQHASFLVHTGEAKDFGERRDAMRLREAV